MFILIYVLSFSVCFLAQQGSTGDSLLLQTFSGDLIPNGSSGTTSHVVSVESSSFIHDGYFRDLFVLPCRFIDQLEVPHADRATNLVFQTTAEVEGEVGLPFNRFNPTPVINY